MASPGTDSEAASQVNSIKDENEKTDVDRGTYVPEEFGCQGHFNASAKTKVYRRLLSTLWYVMVPRKASY